MNRTDTIVAISSAAGSGARAIVRLSGPRAVALAAGVFAPTEMILEDVGPFRFVEGVLSVRSIGGAEISLPAKAYVFRAPRSFTRQDVIELHLPGSPVAAGTVVEHLVAAGARRAEAGEFTARAFFSGRIDLSAAQAVADVIDAASDAQLRSAVGTMRGRLARLCAAITSNLADVMATVEASIDLAEEQIELDSPRELSRRVAQAAGGLDRLAADSCDMPEQAHLPRVVLCGAPNAGKSSLLNALAGFDRAIVSPVAGTTRDVLSATIVLAGSEVLLQDAAGIGDDSDSLSQAAHAAAREAVEAADVILSVAERGKTALHTNWRSLNPRAPMIVLLNKCDLLDESDLRTAKASLAAATIDPAASAGPAILATSALTGAGLDELRAKLTELLHLHVSRGGEALGLHRWQRERVLAACAAATRAGDLLAASAAVADQAELVAIELRDALAHLGQISGQIVSEDILGRIFARFCVGK